MEQFNQRLQSLKADLSLYGDDIVEHINALYDGAKPGARFDLKNDPFGMLSVLQVDVAELLNETQQKVDFRTEHAADIEECKRLTTLLSRIAQTVDKISECESLIAKMSLISACNVLSQLKALLKELPSPSTETGMGKVCRVLVKEHKQLQGRLRAKTDRIFNEAVVFEFGRITVHRELKGILRSEDTIIKDPITLRDVWTVLELLGQEERAVEAVLRSAWVYMFRPLWREKKLPTPRTSRLEEPCVSELVLESLVREGKGLEAGAGRGPGAAGSTGLLRGGSGREAYPDLGQCRMPLSQLLDGLGQVCSFLWTEVLCCDDKVAGIMADKLRAGPGSLVEALTAVVAQQLPKSEAELPQFRRSLEGPCRLLETKLRSYGFLGHSADGSDDEDSPPASASAGPLTAYIADLPTIFADLRRREILRSAREVVLSDYHNTMMATGDAQQDELSSAGDIGDPRAALDQSVSFAMQRLRFESCQTSLAACRLLKLVHDVMRQASAGTTSSATVTPTGGSSSAAPSSSAQIAHALFQSARDCLELFMAVVPMQFADVIDSVPRMGAVFYNDCLYIAHNCTLITHRYRREMARIDLTLEAAVGFADFIPRFRSLGERCLGRHLDEQRAALSELVQRIHIRADAEPTASSAGGTVPSSLEGVGMRGGLLRGGLALAGKISNKLKAAGLVDGAGSGSGSGQAPRCNDEDGAVLVRRQLERLSAQWLGVLQEGTYSRVLGHLVDGVLREAMAPVLAAECVSEAAGAEISRVFRSLQQVRAVFPSSSELREGERGTEDEEVQRVCGSWRKFLALTDLLEYSLSDVADWLPRKKFASFTGTEMAGLIRALFEDSPRRQTLLTSILEMSS